MPRLAFFLLLFTLAACQSGPEVEDVETTDDYGYTERYQRRVENSAREGKYRRYDPQGQLIEEVDYVNDTIHGLRVLYYPATQDTHIVESYAGGQFEGDYRLYYDDGTPHQAGQYAGNEMTGEWKSWYPNGQLMEVVYFEKNLESGPFREWHPNGQLKAEGTYRDGDNEHGELKLYDEQGELARIMECDMGTCRTTWSADAPDSDPTDNS